MIGHQYASDPELHLRDELLFKKHDTNVKCNALDTNRNIQSSTTQYMGPGVAQWLRHCATSRIVPGSNPGGVGHRDFSRGYRQNHVPWGQLSL